MLRILDFPQFCKPRTPSKRKLTKLTSQNSHKRSSGAMTPVYRIRIQFGPCIWTWNQESSPGWPTWPPKEFFLCISCFEKLHFLSWRAGGYPDSVKSTQTIHDKPQQFSTCLYLSVFNFLNFSYLPYFLLTTLKTANGSKSQ